LEILDKMLFSFVEFEPVSKKAAFSEGLDFGFGFDSR
jgi:hypothetical protein